MLVELIHAKRSESEAMVKANSPKKPASPIRTMAGAFRPLPSRISTLVTNAAAAMHTAQYSAAYVQNWMKNLKAAKLISQELEWSFGATTARAHGQLDTSNRHSFRRTRELTSFPDHPSGPRTVMVHLPHASLDLAAVMCPFRLPILTVRTPYGEAVTPAGVDIASIEGLEAEFRFEGDEARVEHYGVNRPTVGSKH